MISSRFSTIIGIFLALLPFMGLPSKWLKFLLPITGLIIVIKSLRITLKKPKNENKAKESYEKEDTTTKLETKNKESSISHKKTNKLKNLKKETRQSKNILHSIKALTLSKKSKAPMRDPAINKTKKWADFDISSHATTPFEKNPPAEEQNSEEIEIIIDESLEQEVIATSPPLPKNKAIEQSQEKEDFFTEQQHPQINEHILSRIGDDIVEEEE